ncbi:YtxH domain-containing protein [bacterium]|nr:YtxH domain-containing protein [bacterium]
MNKLFFIAGGMWLGAGLMYLLDPDRGKRRRDMIRNKATDVMEQAGDALENIEKKGSAMHKQAREFVADTRNAISKTVAS